MNALVLGTGAVHAIKHSGVAGAVFDLVAQKHLAEIGNPMAISGEHLVAYSKGSLVARIPKGGPTQMLVRMHADDFPQDVRSPF